MNIALLGFGVVGRGVYDLVKNIPGLAVTKVVCLEDVQLPDATVTKDFKDVLDDDIHIVVEAMGGLHPAFEFVHAAMEAGKRRMRPIFLTSCTTALGVLPMILSGDLLWLPMGVVICFGTMLSIVLIVLIMPVSYWCIFRKHQQA